MISPKPQLGGAAFVLCVALFQALADRSVVSAALTAGSVYALVVLLIVLAPLDDVAPPTAARDVHDQLGEAAPHARTTRTGRDAHALPDPMDDDWI